MASLDCALLYLAQPWSTFPLNASYQRLHKGQNFWVYSEFLSCLGFNGRISESFKEFLSLLKKYNNLRQVAVKRESMTDYALWTLCWLVGWFNWKLSFPFHRSDYLCVAMFEVPRIQFLRDWKTAFVIDFYWTRSCLKVVAYVAITRFLSRMSWLRAFWGRILHRILTEILGNTQNFGRNSE